MLPRYLVQCADCGRWFCNQTHDGVCDALEHVKQHAQKGELCGLICPNSAIGCEAIACQICQKSDPKKLQIVQFVDMSYAIVCRSPECVKALTEERRYFASTDVVQDKQLSPLLVCAPGPSVLERYHQLERVIDADAEGEQADRQANALRQLDDMYFDDSNAQVLDARMKMYRRQYTSCVALPDRFDVPLSSVQRLDGRCAQPQLQRIGAGQAERINYAWEMQKTIALEQSVTSIRRQLQKIECDPADCAICKEIRDSQESQKTNIKDIPPYEFWYRK